MPKLNRIENYLILNASFSNDIGLVTGKGAVCLFFYYKSNFFSLNSFNGFSYSLLEEIIDGINSQSSIFAGDGVAGFGILLEHLSRKGFIEDEIDLILSEPDNVLAKAILSTSVKNLSFFSGVTGIGFYFLNRLARTSNSNLPNKLLLSSLESCVSQILINVSDNLNERSNLGIVNGLSGILLFLYNVRDVVNNSAAIDKSIIQIRQFLETIALKSKDYIELCEIIVVLLQLDDFPIESKSLKELIKVLNTLLHSKEFKNVEDISLIAITAFWIDILIDQYQLIIFESYLSRLKSILSEKVDQHYLNHFFRINKSTMSINLSMLNGVCSLALFYFSLETRNREWLEIFGLNFNNRNKL